MVSVQWLNYLTRKEWNFSFISVVIFNLQRFSEKCFTEPTLESFQFRNRVKCTCLSFCYFTVGQFLQTSFFCRETEKTFLNMISNSVLIFKVQICTDALAKFMSTVYFEVDLTDAMAIISLSLTSKI